MPKRLNEWNPELAENLPALPSEEALGLEDSGYRGETWPPPDAAMEVAKRNGERIAPYAEEWAAAAFAAGYHASKKLPPERDVFNKLNTLFFASEGFLFTDYRRHLVASYWGAVRAAFRGTPR